MKTVLSTPDRSVIEKHVEGEWIGQAADIFLQSKRYRGREHLSFGTEIRAAFLIDGEDNKSYIATRNVRRFLLRPSIEAIIFSFWPRFRGGVVDLDCILAISSMLCGNLAEFNMHNGFTKRDSSGHYFEFSKSAESIDRILSLFNSDAACERSALHLSAVAYIEINLAHSLSDGNGRLARAAFHAILARHGLTCPFLPMGPVTYIYSEKLRKSLISIGTNCLRSDFSSVFAECVLESLRLSDLCNPLR